ncbi:MAG TPA: hypothetical protein PLV53_08470, partial [Anaerolineaceae bacterium]|nr:hypothetical protein [Anaerolineaceae bacterium]
PHRLFHGPVERLPSGRNLVGSYSGSSKSPGHYFPVTAPPDLLRIERTFNSEDFQEGMADCLPSDAMRNQQCAIDIE